MKLRHILYLCLWLSGGAALIPLAQASGINDTGITTCGNASQNGLTCPVSGFPRQDAEYGPNTFNFTKLDAAGNPLPDTATNHICVRDNYTGLIWEVKTADGGLRDRNNTYTFDEAVAFATAVNTAGGLCGFTDWRLPNPQELDGLVDFSVPYSGPTINTNYFPNSSANTSWTNSSFAYDSNSAWNVSFANSSVNYGDRTYHIAVRLVHGGQSSSSFHDNNDGTVTDASTGLMWSQCLLGQSVSSCTGSSTTMAWDSALIAATASTLAGYNDWRLPNVKELHSLVNYSTYSPSIDVSYFPNAASWTWSSSSYAYDSNNAWFVDFNYGSVGSNYRTNSSAVRPVRGGQYNLTFTLGISKAGTGTGSVTSDVAGIDCGATCTANYAASTAVTLTGTPDTGSVLVGWTGDCSGNQITMDAGKTCIVTFDQAVAPNVSTDAPPSVITATTARIIGTVNPNNAETSVTFGYGLTSGYGSTATATPGSITVGAGATSVYADISGLTCATLYHYQVTATNSAGPTSGNDQTFTTGTCPSATTGAATNPTLHGITLSGTINVGANTGNSSAIFDYSLDTSYNKSVQASPYMVGSGTNNVAVTATIASGLACGTIYNYRLRSGNRDSDMVVYGDNKTFTTGACTVSTTGAASAITTTGATLSGTIDVGAVTGITSAIFQYGTTTTTYSGATQGSPYNVSSGTSNVAITANITGLTCGTLYHYRLKAGNSEGTVYGSDQTFTTGACTVSTTGAASAITTNTATLSGTIDVGAVTSTTSAIFQYGITTTTYSGAIQGSPYTVNPGTSNVAITANITGLTCGTLYHYRLKAGNINGTVYGSDRTFTTGACTVSTTGAATNVITTIAMLNGTIDVGGITSSTSAIFQYSKNDKSYSSAIPGSPYTVNPGTSNVAITANITGLTCGTLYHYRLKAGNINGTVYGSDQTFTTAACTTVTISEPINITNTTAILNGVVNVGGITGNTSAVFQYGDTDSYGNAVVGSPSSISPGTSNVAVTTMLTRLTCSHLYHYRLKAGNTAGSVYSSDGAFTTLACP